MTLMLRASMIGAASLALFASAIPSYVFVYMLGEDYRMAAELLGYALWLLLPLGIGFLLNQLTTARGHFVAAAINPLLGALAMTATIGLLGDERGIAIPLLGVGVGATVWAFAEGSRALHHNWFDGLGGLGRPALAIGLALLVFWLLAEHAPWLALMLAGLLLLPGLASPKKLLARWSPARSVRSNR